MTHRILIAASLALFIAGVGSVIARGSILAYRAAQTEQMITGPESWIAFEADYEVRGPDGVVSTTGRIYRASNGSLRDDAVAVLAEKASTVIFNVEKRMAYYLRPPTSPSWVAKPLILPRDGYRPTSQISLESSVLQRKSPEVWAGFPVWEATGRANGEREARRFLAPALNFHPLRFIHGSTAQHVTRVALVEPAPSRFEPPAEASVIVSAESVRLGRFRKDELPLFGQ